MPGNGTRRFLRKKNITTERRRESNKTNINRDWKLQNIIIIIIKFDAPETLQCGYFARKTIFTLLETPHTIWSFSFEYLCSFNAYLFHMCLFFYIHILFIFWGEKKRRTGSRACVHHCRCNVGRGRFVFSSIVPCIPILETRSYWNANLRNHKNEFRYFASVKIQRGGGEGSVHCFGILVICSRSLHFFFWARLVIVAINEISKKNSPNADARTSMTTTDTRREKENKEKKIVADKINISCSYL